MPPKVLLRLGLSLVFLGLAVYISTSHWLNSRIFVPLRYPVYFEGDDDTLYMDDIYAMDTIQGCGAKLIWITPKLREEWRQKELSTRRIP